MNRYEKLFFKKYIPEGSDVKYIVHEHFVVIMNRLLVMLIGFVFFPCFFYVESGTFNDLINFNIFEIYLIVIYIKIIYDVFDWYNDAWIVTENNVIDLKWALLYIKVNSVNFDSIEGIEVEQNGFFDKMLGKGTLIIHKIGDEIFRLKEAKIPFTALEEIEKIKDKQKVDPEKEEKEKFEVILEALTGVVNQYLESTGHKKKKEKIIEDDIEEFINKEGTLDLR
ncbi:MAG: hypothetical protein PHN31_05510 [Candidatus Gracilibacteria bacterium]|nr:hypothetical protein [Candidatus Gracilibacteria bacterium]